MLRGEAALSMMDQTERTITEAAVMHLLQMDMKITKVVP